MVILVDNHRLSTGVEPTYPRRLIHYFVNHTELSMDNYGTVDNPARISTVLRALMLMHSLH